MQALRILSYKILLFIYSVLIWLANDAFIIVLNSREMLEIVYDASGFDALITSEYSANVNSYVKQLPKPY